MIINKSFMVITIAGIAIVMAMSACTIGEQAPKIAPTPAPTPTPPTASDVYKRLESAATHQPSKLERELKDKRYVRFKGTVTDTEIGKIQFHLGQRPDFGRDKYVNCKMRNELDADKVRVGQEIVVEGRLKDAFNQDGLFGSWKGLENENIVDFKDCVIVRD